MKHSVVFAAAATLAVCGCNRQVTVRIGADLSQFEINKTLSAPSGTTQTIAFVTILRPKCSVIEVPLARVVHGPEHGRLTFAQVDDYPLYPPGFSLDEYDSTPTKGLRISYSPDRGYVGKDEFTFDVFGNQRVVHDHIVENVL